MSNKKNIKLFTLIYYPVLVVLAIVMFVLPLASASPTASSAVDTNKGVQLATSLAGSTANERASFITSYVSGMGIAKVDVQTNEAGKNNASYATDANGKIVPSFAVQEATPSYSELKNYYSANGLGAPVYSGEFVTNIVVSIPGRTTKDASSGHGNNILFVTHYDSFGDTDGATDVALNVASMLLAMEKTLTLDLQNDVTFLFADNGHSGERGVFAYKNNFTGFRDIASFSDLIVDFRNNGTAGSLMLLDIQNAGYSLIKDLNKSCSSVYFNSLATQFVETDSLIENLFSDKMVLTLGNIGKGENMYTQNDNIDNLSNSLLSQTAGTINGIIDGFGNVRLSQYRGETDAHYVTVFSGFNVVVAGWVTYLIGGIITALLVGFIVANYFFKVFDYKNLALGAISAAIATVFALVGLLVVHYLTALMGAGFSVYSFRSIATLSYNSVGAFVSAVIVAGASAMAGYAFFKWLFRIKTREIVAGNAVVVALVGAILAFMGNGFALAFNTLAIATMVVAIAVTCLRVKFRSIFAMDIDRLFPFVWAILFGLPCMVGTLYTALCVLGISMYPATLTMMVLVLGFIAPYFGFLDGKLQLIANKLPQRRVRMYRLIEKEVEDPAVKGKMVTETVKENFEKKVDRKYHIAVGITAIMMVGFVLFASLSLSGYNIASNLSYKAGEVDPYYDDSIIYSVTYNNAGTLSGGEWIIKDRDAYNRIAFDVFDYDSDRNAWVRSDVDSRGEHRGEIISSTKSGSDKIIYISPKNGSGEYTVTLNSLSTATRILVESDIENYTINITSGTEIIIKGTGMLTITVSGSSEYTGRVDYEEFARGVQAFNYLLATNPVKSLIDSRMVYHLTCSQNV